MTEKLPIIKAQIDVTKINKGRLYKGKKGTYLNIVLLPTSSDQYGNDYAVKEDVTKEEREAGLQLPFIGNAKIAGKKQEQQRPADAPEYKPDEADDGIPF